jgi:hypothetical protein
VLCHAEQPCTPERAAGAVPGSSRCVAASQRSPALTANAVSPFVPNEVSNMRSIRCRRSGWVIHWLLAVFAFIPVATRARSVAFLLAFSLGHVASLAAQQPDAVEIRPVSLTALDVAPYSTNTQRFWIKNTGTQSNQYSIFANVCTPYDLYCDWSNTFLGTIAFGDSVPFDVKFTAGHAGTSGTISFDARISTNQSVRATKNVTVNARQEMHLEVDALNPGSAEERDLCVTVAVATDAAYECGVLRLVHALPSVRARGTVRTPTLLYNSRFAHPFGLVQATLSVLPTTSRTSQRGCGCRGRAGTSWYRKASRMRSSRRPPCRSSR